MGPSIRLAGAATLPLLVATFLLLLSLPFFLLGLPACPPRGFLCTPALYRRPAAAAGSASESAPTTLDHLVFGIASSARSLPQRSGYLRRWWDPARLRGFVFLDSPLPGGNAGDGLPPLRVSNDTSWLPYSFPRGLRSAVRVARVVRELVEAAEGLPGVRWVVLGDDDTVFFPENLAASLRRRDWERWHYVGASSEAVEQNEKYSFDMAFGGGGFALSWPLARALVRVLDSCLVRYAHLYGSDARVFSCLAELGVGMTRDHGFHQIQASFSIKTNPPVDLRGDIFGMLTAHPLTPLVSLHHLDYVEPIFPGMDRVQALEHLFEAVRIDPGRILQQTVCYDQLALHTVSISWGYAVQVFNGNILLPDILSWQRTFTPWKRGLGASSSHYMFNTREFPKDVCKRPVIFFLESIASEINGIYSKYSKHTMGTCPQNKASEKLKQIKVSSSLHSGQFLRRQCCDIFPSTTDEVMEINIRECRDELISMSP
ncbi:hypothetical protein Taro_029764 [Colocasia esculenta]|uniref:Uncharacterized protein n=1 Tax=Colocasia esculenta TaxID=4460 RepID=A0A843VJS0_COLES|nr:hypothetical protein [Colocasia esculenta]